MYEAYGDHRGQHYTLYFFFIFLLTVRRIRMFFSLKLSVPQENHPSKFLLIKFNRLGGVREQTKNTETLTDILLLL